MADETTKAAHLRRLAIFFAVVLALIAAAIVRSNITTGLDSFTFDEGYHIGAGAAYIQTGDFRLNPEQPPLTKLWVGSYVTMLGYQVSPYRAFADKGDERDFVEEDAYKNNDPFVLQARARTAMFALNGLLLFCFAMAARRVFGDAAAIGATLFLAIDPTVAAHMPVVMTDLPIALSSATAILLAAHAFRTWKWYDLTFAAVFLGVALSAKHSGIITLAAVGVIGMAMAIAFSKGSAVITRLRRSGAVLAVVIGGVVTLWAFYGFHYRETPGVAEDTFNRTLPDKISDVRSPLMRTGLNVMAGGHLFPRAYVWGLADTIRAGVEGRAIQVRAFGESYYSQAPFYFFPGIVAAKLPIGLLVLSLVGLVFLIARQIPRDLVVPFIVFAAYTAIFLGVLVRGSTYAGVRHALPLFPFMALLAGLAVYAATAKRSYALGAVAALAFILAAVSAVPQMRPWEYFNALAGGAEHGYLYFNDEGVDLSQRIGEAADFYHRELEAKGDVPFLAYFSNSADRRARGMDWVGNNRERDDAKFDGDTVTGTFMIGANELGEGSWWDVGKPFRSTQPAYRLGNLFVFQGTFQTPKAMRARGLFYRAIYSKIYVAEPDLAAGIEGIERSIALDDSFFAVQLELGNQYLKLGNREKALAAYTRSLELAPRTDSIYDLIANQVSMVASVPLETIAPLRNPSIE